jgi:penicillin-binding protein 2
VKHIPKPQKLPEPSRRLYLVMGTIALSVLVLITRLWYLQIVEGQDHAIRSDVQKMHEERLQGPRGRIFARNPRNPEDLLADTRPARDVIVIPAECENTGEVAARLANVLNIDGEKLAAELNAHVESEMRDGQRLLPYAQVYVKKDISRWELGRLSEAMYALPGVHVTVRPQRYYLHGKTAGQLLGYLGEINREELAELQPTYAMGDVIGRKGLEMLYEPILRGTDGKVIVSRYASVFSRPQLLTDDIGTPSVAMDTRGRELEELMRRDPIPGQSLRLTIDLELQQEAERLLAVYGHVGSLTALNAETGEILAMASAPSYDPNAFVTSGRSQERIELINDPKQPMEHRAYRYEYPPGSVFKIAVAIAALEENVINENTKVSCHGYNRELGLRCWRWRYGGHGAVNVVEALSQSCDIFFYDVGLKLGLDRLHEWATKLGMGHSIAQDLPGERPGLMPSKQWKIDLVGEDAPVWEKRIYPAEIAMISMGQSFVLATPLQNAQLMAVAVNGGRRLTPFINFDKPPGPGETICSPRTAAIVQEGLRQCVEDDKPPSGTGVIAQIDGLIVLGKTGTAQIVSIEKQEKYKNEKAIPYELRDHAWFVAGVMGQDPPLAVCAMVEHGHQGSTAAGPLARDLIKFFYERPPAPDDYAVPITVAQSGDPE